MQSGNYLILSFPHDHDDNCFHWNFEEGQDYQNFYWNISLCDTE